MALVDVICPVFNSERWIKLAIESLENQSFLDWRLILVDDCSNDNSIAGALQILMKSKLKIIKLAENSGNAAASKSGFEVADAKYIARFDADDLNFANRLSHQVQCLEEFNSVNALSSPMVSIDSENRTTGKFSWNNLQSLEVNALLPIVNVINNPTTFFRAEAIHGKISVSPHRIGSDYFTWLTHQGSFQWQISKAPLVYWRKHNANVSRFGYSYSEEFTLLRYRNLLRLGVDVLNARM
jgi:glycosyltransferase involved in cell wall biosynthesis